MTKESKLRQLTVFTVAGRQEYPTEPLDKIPALQAEFELAGKKTLAN